MAKKQASPAPFYRRKKIILSVIGIVAALLITAALASYFLIANKVGKILPGNPLDAITKNEQLKSDQGRTNILIFGTSYDDPNPDHDGGYLTDSLMVLSIDRNAKTAHTVSVPRDLWVDYGMDCGQGESGKINALYSCALDANGESETTLSAEQLGDKIGNITGLDIHYHLEANYTFIKSLTNALGGIDVNIYSDDERGIYDPAVNLKLPAGTSRLDGETALKLARARNSHGGYGLSRSNFDREINQQRIVAAIFKKASSDGTLNDPADAIRLLDALGGQVRTNVQTSELRDAVSLARSLNVNKIVSIPLTDYMTTGNRGGQSIVLPEAGLGDYSAIQEYIAEELSSAGDEQ